MPSDIDIASTCRPESFYEVEPDGLAAETDDVELAAAPRSGVGAYVAAVRAKNGCTDNALETNKT